MCCRCSSPRAYSRRCHERAALLLHRGGRRRLRLVKKIPDLPESRLDVPVNRCEIAAADDTAAVDEKRRGHASREVRPQNVTVVANDVERQPEAARERTDFGIAARSMLTATTRKPRAAYDAYILCIDAISSRQPGHHVAQTASSTTLPR